MKMKQKADIFRYGAGACFALLAILLLTKGIYFPNSLYVIAYLLMAASFFAQIPTLGTVGSGLYILITVIQIRWWYGLEDIICDLLLIVAYVIFLIMTLKRGNAKQLSYAAAAVVVVRVTVVFITCGSYISTGFPLVSALLLAAGFLLAGFAYANMTLKPQKPAVSAQQNTVVDSIQRLEKLQHLLEQGIITQEEFDAKKKQLLGL